MIAKNKREAVLEALLELKLRRNGFTPVDLCEEINRLCGESLSRLEAMSLAKRARRLGLISFTYDESENAYHFTFPCSH